MKKIFLTACLAAGFTALFAEGYQVNLQSTKQAGMGHTGTAMKLGAESMHFNPAGLAFMDKKLDVSAGVSFVCSNVEYTATGGSYTAQSESKPSTPIYLYAGYKVNKNLAAGISVTNPYGSGLKWPSDWNGAHLVQEISLKTFSIQPTFSYKLFDRISLGAGLMIFTGNVAIDRAMLPKGFGTLPAMISAHPLLTDDNKQALGAMLGQYADKIPAEAKLSGTSKVGVGYNIGAMFDITKQWTIGVSYRSEVKMKVEKGETAVSYAQGANQAVATLEQILGTTLAPIQNGANFAASMPLPANLNVGLSYKPNEKLILSADFQYVFWSAYDSLNITFPNNYVSKQGKNYSNAFAVRVGGQYSVLSYLDARLGVYFDKTPVNSTLYSPETPGADKLGISAGLSFRPIKNFSIDAAFTYINGFKQKDVYCPVGHPLAGITGQDADGAPIFGGDYKVSAFMPSIGVSYKF